jgi:hypothetical protein
MVPRGTTHDVVSRRESIAGTMTHEVLKPVKADDLHFPLHYFAFRIPFHELILMIHVLVYKRFDILGEGVPKQVHNSYMNNYQKDFVWVNDILKAMRLLPIMLKVYEAPRLKKPYRPRKKGKKSRTQ